MKRIARPASLTTALLILVSAASAADTKTNPDRTAAEVDPLRPPAVETDNVPPVPPELADRLRQYQAVRSAGFRGFSPDGRGILVETRFGDTAQLHRVYEPGGRREQITFFDEPVDGEFIPQDDEGDLLVTMSRGGDEQYQIYHFDRSSGKATLLTDGKSRNLLGPVDDDGSRMIIASNRRNGRDTDLYVADTREPGTMKMLLETDGEYWIPADFSSGGKRLLINRYVSINETYPALLDVAGGKKRMIPVPGGAKASFGAMAFGADGENVYLASDAKSEFRQLARVDLEDFRYYWLTEEIPWDVAAIEVEPKTGLIAFTTNEDGASALYFLADPGAAKVTRLFERGDPLGVTADKPSRVDLPLGIISSLEFSPDGKRLGFTLSRPDAPADAFSLDLQDGRLTRWTYSEVGGLDTAAFVKPRRIQFESFDGRTIPAYYFKPNGATKEKPAAVLINIHGGPESQYRPYFSALDQFFVNELGIAVIRPNVRGSAGYGKTYLRLDNAERREDSVRDIGALLDWVGGQPELDKDRVAVIGGSYGGYMVLASLIHYPERIRAGVDIVGIASFTTFLKNTSEYRRDLRRAEYGDERDPKMQAVFERINPTANADKIKSALLVAHGKNDPRVPFSEAVQIADEVTASGQAVWTLYAENEGHGFRKKPNRDYLYAVVVMFLRDHLRPGDAPQ